MGAAVDYRHLRWAAAIALASVLGACFPDNERARHIAYATEGGAIVAGLLLLAFVHPPGDCYHDDLTCRSHGNEAEAGGLFLLFGGLAGGVVTLLSAEDGDRKTIVVQPGTPSPAPAPTK